MGCEKIVITSMMVEREMIDAPGDFPDPGWVFTDKLGQEHRWQEESDGSHTLPTLKRDTYMEEFYDEAYDRNEEVLRVRYTVPTTGEEVTPGVRYEMRHIPGVMSGSFECTFECTGNPWDDPVIRNSGIPLTGCIYRRGGLEMHWPDDFPFQRAVICRIDRTGPTSWKGEGTLSV